MSAKRGLRIRGLRQRWLVNAVLPIVLVVIAIVTVYTLGVRRTYYSAMRSGLETRARVAADNFSSYGLKSYSEYFRYASITAETFEEKDRLELQFINVNGRVQVSSYGLTAGTQPGTSDVTEAVATGKPASFEGLDPQTGERILSVSAPLRFNGRVIGVLRYVTALHEADRSVLVSMAVAIGVALLCVGLAIFSNAIFINNVVEPVAVVSDAARRISAGSYGILIDNHYRDELGELVDNINDMSLKISQSEKMESEFISSVSHELRTPLTAINGWGETLLEDESCDAQQLRRGVQIILKESRRLTNMVEELLDFSKMTDGRFTLQVEDTDLQAELEDAVYTYRELFRQDGISLEYTSDKALYEEPITGDPERLKQVFCNVLDNAAKHGGSGKRIVVRLTQENEAYVITIRDFGPGIPVAELPYVKQKFYKGSSRARGSGIGLAVCDEIVNLHGGRFDIGNAEGGGTVVTIRLPLKRETEKEL